jgi:hypothetical protein
MTSDGQLAFDDGQLLAAIAWRERNPDAYRELVLWAREDEAHGARPSIALYVELLRRPWFANKLRLSRSDVQFLVNNNLRAELARLLQRDHGFEFALRKSMSDPKEAA